MTSKILVLGGARSGKTAFAQNKCEGLLTPNLIYLATAPNIDSEMDTRINRHRQERGDKWQTIEEKINIADIIDGQNSLPEASQTCILLDCLTLWLNNLIYHKCDIEAAKAKLVMAITAFKGDIIIISNEVGQGIIADNAAARYFVDQQGWLNQLTAKTCDEAYFIFAGCPLKLK